MYRPVIILSFLFVLALDVSAQLLPFRTYSIEHGLSESVAHDLLQDRDGYIWIGTGYGLNRFDGIQFQRFYEENGLLANRVNALFEDKEGTLWIGTAAGVNILDGDTLITREELDPLRGVPVLEIFQDSYDEYWFATDDYGVWHYDLRGKLTQYTTIHGLASNRVRDIVESPDGALWFATRGGLTSLKDGNFRSYAVAEGLPDEKLRDLELDRNGNLWIATRGGLSYMTEGRFINYTEADGLVNNLIQSVSLDDKENLWIGTEEGVSYFADGEFANYSVLQGLSNNFVYSTLFDQEQNIWFGTLGGGISMFLGDNLRNFTIEEGLPNNVITDIVQDASHNYWISTYGGGVAKYDGKGFELYNQSNGLVDNKVYTLTVDSRNRIWIGTRWGLSILEGDSFKNFDETDLPYRKIRGILEREAQEEYWIATYGEGVIRYKNDRFSQLTEEDGLANNTVMKIVEDNEGALWFATYGGVSRYEAGNFTNFTVRDGLPNNGVMDILKDGEGALWFSTFNGLGRYSEGELQSITQRDGLPDELCYFIVQDNRGIYWIGTNHGVIRFDYEIYRNSDSVNEKRSAFKMITQNQGLVANEMNAGAGYTDREGKLWFGSVGGVTQLDPVRERINEMPPKIHIRQISLAGEPLKMLRQVGFSSESRSITFEFIGISFTAPEQVIYEYRLEGSGENRQRTAQRFVRYSTLLPGDYTFRVRARNSDGIWSTETASISFTVLAPFWMRWWFVLLVGGGIAGIIFFIWHYLKVKKMVEIERMRVRIASDLHDDVGSSLTEIALQSDFLQTTELDESFKRSLHQIGEQSRKIVSTLDDIVWSIDARNDSLGDLTDRMQDYTNNVLSNKEIIYNFEDIDSEEKLNIPIRENLYLIFKEAVNNIARHSNATRVEISLGNEEGKFDLTVRDNGTNTKGYRKTGHGLRNMEMRAQRINADIEITNTTGFTVHVSGKGM